MKYLKFFSNWHFEYWITCFWYTSIVSDTLLYHFLYQVIYIWCLLYLLVMDWVHIKSFVVPNSGVMHLFSELSTYIHNPKTIHSQNESSSMYYQADQPKCSEDRGFDRSRQWRRLVYPSNQSTPLSSSRRALAIFSFAYHLIFCASLIS